MARKMESNKGSWETVGGRKEESQRKQVCCHRSQEKNFKKNGNRQ